MPITFDIEIEKDVLYKRGEAKGEARGEAKGVEKERIKNVISLWQNGIESPMISNLLNIPVEDVERMIAQSKKA